MSISYLLVFVFLMKFTSVHTTTVTKQKGQGTYYEYFWGMLKFQVFFVYVPCTWCFLGVTSETTFFGGDGENVKQ